MPKPHAVFKPEAPVRWTSQSQGSTAKKHGKVVAVLLPGAKPDPAIYPKLAKNCGSGRNHESYIVEVQVGPKNRSVYYWPVVSVLTLDT
jgi:hypothetical protein